MAPLTLTLMRTAFLDALVINTSTDAPIATTEVDLALNDALADIYEVEGGGVKTVASATAWTTAQSATGVVNGILTDIKDVLHVWASQTSGSVGVSSGDNELEHVPLTRVQRYRKAFTTGTYDRPKVCAITRLDTVTPADVGKMRLDYYPSVTGFYFPIEYIPQFTVLDASSVTTPNISDLGSRDVPLWAAIKKAQNVGRAELVPGLMAQLSERNSKVLARKLATMLTGEQAA